MTRKQESCPFTTLECNGGTIYQDGSIGCVFKETPGVECSWMDDVPAGSSPRNFYLTLMAQIKKD